MKKIAIINDDIDFLTAMETLLKDFGGYDPILIHEGNAAYHLVKSERPDLTILDIRLDSTASGWHVLDLLTLDPATNSIPVIVCTAEMKIPEEKELWLKEHGIDILPKPFDINDMIALVERALKPKGKTVVKEPN